MFSQACVKNSVHRGVTPWADTTPPPGRPPWEDIPPLGRHPPGQTHTSLGRHTPLDRHPPGRTPPLGQIPPPPDGHCSRRYAYNFTLILVKLCNIYAVSNNCCDTCFNVKIWQELAYPTMPYVRMLMGNNRNSIMHSHCL